MQLLVISTNGVPEAKIPSKIPSSSVISSFVILNPSGDALQATLTQAQAAFGINTSTGTANTFFGVTAGNTTTTGAGFNTAFGNNALSALTSGNSNVAVGASTAIAVTTGNNNIAIGVGALNANTTGGQNVAVGGNALLSLNNSSTNQGSVGIGQAAGKFTTTGVANVFVGQQAGNFNVTGSNNTIVGELAGNGVTGNSFDNNALFGRAAGTALTTGSNNTFIGTSAGLNVTTGANNIIIGYNLNGQVATDSNKLIIGNLIFGTAIDGTGTTLSSGNIGIGVVAPTSRLMLPAGTATAGTSPFGFTSSGVGIIGLLTVPVKGVMEFSDYGLWFTPGATRHKIWEGLTTGGAPVSASVVLSTTVYGANTGLLGTPDKWITVTGEDGVVYVIAAYIPAV